MGKEKAKRSDIYGDVFIGGHRLEIVTGLPLPECRQKLHDIAGEISKGGSKEYVKVTTYMLVYNEVTVEITWYRADSEQNSRGRVIRGMMTQQSDGATLIQLQVNRIHSEVAAMLMLFGGPPLIMLLCAKPFYTYLFLLILATIIPVTLYSMYRYSRDDTEYSLRLIAQPFMTEE